MANQQKPKIGRKVIIARAIRGGIEGDHYFHGGYTHEVALGTRGQILKIENEKKVCVKTDSGKTWWVHTDELKYFPGLIEPLPGADRLERHSVFEMSDSTPIVVANGKVYTVEGQFNPNDRRINANVELGTLSSFDEMHLDRNSSLIQKLKENYSKQVWSSLSSSPAFEQGNSDIPVMIAEQVFPYLRAEGYKSKVLDMIGVEKVEERKEENKKRDPFSLEKITDKILGEINELRQELSEESLREVSLEDRTPKQKRLDALLSFFREDKQETYGGPEKVSRAVGSQTYLVSQGSVTHLMPGSGGLLEKTVEIDSKSYKLGENFDLRLVEDLHRNLVSQEIRSNVVETNFTREQVNKELEARLGELSRFAGLKEYDEGDFGFTTNDGKYFIWIRVPAFGIKNPENGKYYYFKESKVGFYISKSEERLVLGQNYPRILEDNLHPWAHGEGNFGGICLGDHYIDTGKLSGDKIAKSLNSLRDLMLYAGTNPYTDRFFHYLLEDSRLRNRNHITKSKDELVKMGVAIFE